MPPELTDANMLVPLAVLLGLLVGSFLNVVIHRMPRMLEREWQSQCAALQGDGGDVHPSPAYNLLVPASACPHCGHAIRWHENIPILSYLWLKGRCAGCGARISPRYPLVEAASGLLAGLAAWHFAPDLHSLWVLALLWALLALTVIDLDTHLLPDRITLPLLWLGLLVNLDGHFAPLGEAVLGAVAGYLSLWLVYHGFRLATGKEGMGYGDFKLLAALGAWLGWKMLPLIILSASLAGALIGIAMIAFLGHDRARPIPFGPWLALGGVTALFWGHDMIALYLG